MAFGIHIPSGSPAQLAARDVERYGRLLIAKGGTDIFANGRASVLRGFWQACYEILGAASGFEFWALRATDNMGSGSVIYSSRGLGGTLVNGPTHAADGINLVGASSQCINTGRVPPLPAAPLCMVVDNTTGTTGQFLFGRESATAASGSFGIITHPSVYSAIVRFASTSITTVPPIDNTVGGWHSRSLTHNTSGGLRRYRNASLVGSASYGGAMNNTGAANPVSIGAYRLDTTPGFFADGKFAFALLADVPTATAATVAALNAALKTTILSDLGLP